MKMIQNVSLKFIYISHHYKNSFVDSIICTSSEIAFLDVPNYVSPVISIRSHTYKPCNGGICVVVVNVEVNGIYEIFFNNFEPGCWSFPFFLHCWSSYIEILAGMSVGSLIRWPSQFRRLLLIVLLHGSTLVLL